MDQVEIPPRSPYRQVIKVEDICQWINERSLSLDDPYQSRNEATQPEVPHNSTQPEAPYEATQPDNNRQYERKRTNTGPFIETVNGHPISNDSILPTAFEPHDHLNSVSIPAMARMPIRTNSTVSSFYTKRSSIDNSLPPSFPKPRSTATKVKRFLSVRDLRPRYRSHRKQSSVTIKDPDSSSLSSNDQEEDTPSVPKKPLRCPSLAYLKSASQALDNIITGGSSQQDHLQNEAYSWPHEAPLEIPYRNRPIPQYASYYPAWI